MSWYASDSIHDNKSCFYGRHLKPIELGNDKLLNDLCAKQEELRLLLESDFLDKCVVWIRTFQANQNVSSIPDIIKDHLMELLSPFKSQIEEQNQKCDMLEELVTETQSELCERQSELSKLKRENDIISEKLAISAEERRSTVGKAKICMESHKDYDDIKSELLNVKNKLATIEQYMYCLTKERNVLRSQNNELISKNRELQLDQQTHNALILNATEQYQENEETIEALNQVITSLRNEMESNRTTYEKCKQECEQLRAELQSEKTQICSKQVQVVINKYEEKLSTLRNNLSLKFNEEKRKLFDANSNLRKQLKHMSYRLAEQNEKVYKLSEHIEASDFKYKNSINSAQEKIYELEMERDKLKSSSRTAMKNCRRFENELKQLQAEHKIKCQIEKDYDFQFEELLKHETELNTKKLAGLRLAVRSNMEDINNISNSQVIDRDTPDNKSVMRENPQVWKEKVFVSSSETPPTCQENMCLSSGRNLLVQVVRQ
ncbi:hypothetical protein GJ496_004374 [Pomphorhynchus laevis]|nr:hypothetical protein GJ496_004374 [Pomphorhynchus laevis]